MRFHLTIWIFLVFFLFKMLLNRKNNSDPQHKKYTRIATHILGTRTGGWSRFADARQLSNHLIDLPITLQLNGSFICL